MKKLIFILLILSNNSSAQTIHNQLLTRWSKEPGSIGHNEYPRPQLKRNKWTNLNGKWQYAITDSTSERPKFGSDSILVPFPLESFLSGAQKKLLPSQILWYRRTFDLVDPSPNLLLNFGAIDYEATVYLNGIEVGRHSGGYLSFSLDIGKYSKTGNNELIIKITDPTETGINPHGKQTSIPANIYYTPISGIWQTVWLEQLDYYYVSSIQTKPNIDKGSIELTINLNHPLNTSKQIEISALYNKTLITKATININKGRSSAIATLSLPNPKLWTPDHPELYDLVIKLYDNKKVYDKIESYFGLRKVDIRQDERGMDRIFLNNKYTYNLGVLDQGYWPEGLYTAPNDSALLYDIMAIKEMGFNTIRKHIKIEPQRWYYYADKFGILVWQDFVNPPHQLPTGAKDVFEDEIKKTIAQLRNHPSIIMWVLFNEGWGAYDQSRLTKLIKQYDSTRLVNGHSGEMLFTNNKLRKIPSNPWAESDIIDIHSYPFPRMAPSLPRKAKVIGEFGGIGVQVNGHEWNDMQAWGYIQVNADNLKMQYKNMVDSLKNLEYLGISGSIYTQPFDVEGEENGLITYDREIIKIPLDTLRLINSRIVGPMKKDIDKGFFIAKNIDPHDNDSRFDELLVKFHNGDRDSALLRRLTLMAFRLKKQDKVTEIGNEFINNLVDPFSPSNLSFIQLITQTSNDKGFDLFRTDPEKVDKYLGENFSVYTVKRIIRKEFITPYAKDTTKPHNWDKIQDEIVKKFGKMGEEAILGTRMLEYSGYFGNKPDYEKFGKFYVLYFKKALKHPDYKINDVSWIVFEHVNDPEVLRFAIEVVKYSIDRWDRSPEIFDTYANLLHKTQQTQKAIEWESKALELTKGTRDEKLFAETLQKMKDNKPTWPQN